jgi:hypothetical protein
LRASGFLRTSDRRSIGIGAIRFLLLRSPVNAVASRRAWGWIARSEDPDPPTRCRAGSLHYQAACAKGQVDRAIQDYDQAIKLNPSDADLFYGRSSPRQKRATRKAQMPTSQRRDASANFLQSSGMPSKRTASIAR